MPYALISPDGTLTSLPNSTTRAQMGKRWDGHLGKLYGSNPSDRHRFYAYSDDMPANVRGITPVENPVASELMEQKIWGDCIIVGAFGEGDDDRDKPLSDVQWSRLALYFSKR